MQQFFIDMLLCLYIRNVTIVFHLILLTSWECLCECISVCVCVINPDPFCNICTYMLSSSPPPPNIHPHTDYTHTLPLCVYVIYPDPSCSICTFIFSSPPPPNIHTHNPSYLSKKPALFRRVRLLQLQGWWKSNVKRDQNKFLTQDFVLQLHPVVFMWNI